MPTVRAELSSSLDGFVAGPEPSLEEPLGRGGMQLHEWVFGLASWRARHGMEGGETTADSAFVDEALARTGATVMGRRMFSGGSGPWEDDPQPDGWWGDDPPFRTPVLVLTHHPRETVHKENGTSYTFVTDGIAAAVEQARAAAGGLDVAIAGGASVVQQALAAGLVDELLLHVAPVLLGSGTRLLDGLAGAAVSLEKTQVADSPLVTHLRYRVMR